jgi:hypothetical protein
VVACSSLVDGLGVACTKDADRGLGARDGLGHVHHVDRVDDGDREGDKKQQHEPDDWCGEAGQLSMTGKAELPVARSLQQTGKLRGASSRVRKKAGKVTTWRMPRMVTGDLLVQMSG